MATKGQALQVAASQIGVKESPFGSNRTRYGSWYGMNGVPWCDIFISWVFASVGASAAVGGKFAYCPYHLNWFRAHGRLYRNPSVGDIVFFRFPGMSVTGHIGIVEKVLSGGRIQTIEGNTSLFGSQNNGGGVCRKIRSSNAYVSGYGRPAYSGTTYVPAVSRASGRTPVGVVRGLQSAVRVSADGKWGPNTHTALRAVILRQLGNVKYLQARIGATQDGRWGPKSEAARIATIKKIQRAIGTTADGAWGAKSQASFNAAKAKYYGK